MTRVMEGIRVLEVALERVPQALADDEPVKPTEEAAKPVPPAVGPELLTH